MKFALIIAVAIIGLVYNKVASDSSSASVSSSEETETGNFLNLNLPVNPRGSLSAANNNCQTCSSVIAYVNKSGGKSMLGRSTSLQNACNEVGSGNLVQCQQFLSTYKSQIVQFIRPGSNPIGTCKLLQVCS